MPWNQPGSDNRNKNSDEPSGDPWGQGSGSGRRGNGRPPGPPDIDEVLQQLKNKFDSFFSGKGRGAGGKSGGRGPFIAILFVVLGYWVFTGFYTVDEGEQAIELRFGRYSQTTNAGLHWRYPYPVEQVEVINTENVNAVEVGYRTTGRTIQSFPKEALMLTEDENIIDIQFAVQYNIKDPRNLLFNVRDYNTRDLADTVVRQATESAVREIVGRNTMDFAITEGRGQLVTEVEGLVQDILDRYETGVNIRTVAMRDAQPPMQVKDAFDDAVRAREDEERLKNLAEAYANDILPRARGHASRIQQESEAYKASVIARAEGETARFDQVLTEYAKAPSVTRTRLYLETMEQVFSRTSKMVIDQQQGGNNVMYLPLDQLLKNRPQNTSGATQNYPSGSTSSISTSDNATEREAARISR